jgi:hypothetical protein
VRIGNPLRSEDAAFRALLLVVAVMAAVVLIALLVRALT